MSLLSAAALSSVTPEVAAPAIQWADLGLTEGIDLGFFTLRYYSLAYLLGIIFAYWHTSKMLKQPGAPMAQRHADDLFFYSTLGVILGGRLGYALFYKPELFSSFEGDGFVSWELLRLWDGGMSFHGGLIGVLLAIAFVSRQGKLSFLRVCDYVAVSVPMGMLLGRLANFVNGELWGRTTDVPWAMAFPEVVNGVLITGPPRHPSQLYEAALEGLLLLIILLVMFWKTRARYRPGLLVGVFTTGIALGRFIVEFFRQPDEHLTEFAVNTGLSMGQWLTIPLILLGVAITIRALRNPPLASGAAQNTAN
ncbi:prolipoprotein diacylglyceryl transferase [Pontixanthobacter aquaemixtae]|uniref:Phosphatidylglycerol--prolipoprotein diacylglyceryl transferase n=1 Tax=Pontixanthobacter aquaemixtae TaxID=1958940 RepID=A0A844ZVZ4_9SPHN|nr:prolipoprotein diacylglyceryl transferase [Pontixanthobacter aquaemixtae]MXO91634.1 prolipoprotein diacylglyceryl transferase [Pontixanthobacter aquaemixtae]